MGRQNKTFLIFGYVAIEVNNSFAFFALQMPEIPTGGQVFDVVFHPTSSTVYTALLTGHIKAFAYNDQGGYKATFSLRPSKRSCRGLSLDADGSHLYAVGKSKALNIIDTSTETVDIRGAVHDSPINRVQHLMPWLLSTGDDEGIIKLWDPRQRECTRTYTHHFDYISDFLWLQDKKQLIATSGDGTLSVMDVRSKKPEPIAQSEDQEDELLSIVAIKNSTKVVVGTQIGILSIFNRSSGWGDCVDRVPGHPMSIDAMCSLPDTVFNVDTTSTILTGSSDGYVRAVQILPTKLLGVVADHGEWPIEQIAIGSGMHQLTIDDSTKMENASQICKPPGEDSSSEEEATEHRSKWWVGSVGHEDVLRMTDLEGFFRDREQNQKQDGDTTPVKLGADDGSDSDEELDREETMGNAEALKFEMKEEELGSGDESDDEPKQKKRKRKSGKEVFVKKKKGKNEVVVEGAFFGDL